MGPHLTPTRLALLADVRDGQVFMDVIGNSYISGDRMVNARITEMAAAGWVTLPDGDDRRLTSTWQLTDKGREVLDPPTYTVTFERIGRNHNVPPLTVPGPASAQDIAEQVYRLARSYLISRDYEVTVDLAEGKGWIESGRFGKFEIRTGGA